MRGPSLYLSIFLVLSIFPVISSCARVHLVSRCVDAPQGRSPGYYWLRFSTISLA